MKYKFLTVLFLSIMFFSCDSSDDFDPNTDPNPLVVVKKQYVNKLKYTNTQGTVRNFDYTYNSDNNIISVNTPDFNKTYTYSGNNIVKLENITNSTNTLYYVVDYFYRSDDKLDYFIRTNENGSKRIYQYLYSNTGKVKNVYRFNSEDDFNNLNIYREFILSYDDDTTNFKEIEYITNSNFTLKIRLTYDNNESVYLGEAANKIALPFATTGFEIFNYHSNNVIAEHRIDENNEILYKSREMINEYFTDKLPSKITDNRLNNLGEITSTTIREIEYELK